MVNGMYIAIDFDGTCVTHDYPRIGKDIHAVNVLKRLVANGHKLILNTMRSGKELDDAVNWFKEHNIELFGVNENPTQKSWTESPKVYAHMYIDDAAFGCPLLNVPELSDRPFVNWPWIELKLTQMEII
jgi:hydroxymethylpyrimidine pyrophosphatase-like HAD family hydrolase